MGVLSDSARKAYKVGARRAHVPEWFLPASYVFGVIAAGVLIIGILFRENPRPLPSVDGPADVVVIGPDGTATLDTATVPPTDTTNGSTNGSAIANPGSGVITNSTVGGTVDGTAGGTESAPLLDGGEADVPVGSWTSAQRATFALLTGDFSTIEIYPGKTAPILLTTWDEPSILGLVSFNVNADGSLRFVLRVDPDATGKEPARDVPILLAAAGNGWAYLPG